VGVGQGITKCTGSPQRSTEKIGGEDGAQVGALGWGQTGGDLRVAEQKGGVNHQKYAPARKRREKGEKPTAKVKGKMKKLRLEVE